MRKATAGKVIKPFVTFSMAAALSVSGSFMAFGAGWKNNATGWWYEEGTEFIRNQWKEIGGAWYYFNQDGYMLTGWQNLNGDWYYLGTDGAMVTGKQLIGGKSYYFNNDGKLGTEAEGSAWKEAYKKFLLDNLSRYGSDYTFGFIDMDGDGVDELFICFNNSWIVKAFTYQDGAVKPIGWEDTDADTGPSKWYDDGTISIINDHQIYGFKHFYKYEDGKFKTIAYMDYDCDENGNMFYTINGHKCTQKQYNSKVDELENKKEINWEDFMHSYTSSNIYSVLKTE